jgi:metal-responsive CopG/Arc/MetJ family transcriptional regulator
MKIGVSLPDQLISFADEEARSRGTTRSGLLAELLEAERQRKQLSSYLDRYGWDVAEDDEAWREYQRHRMAQEYGADDW